MKTLYININKEQIQSNEELEVLNYDMDSVFFFYLGEKIAEGLKVKNENALIADFNTQDNAEDYQKIIAQWNEIKAILFSEECKGAFKFTLPGGYIHWLRYHPQYVSIYDRNFSHSQSAVITIDLEELYEDSVEDLQSKILRKLQRDDLCLEIDEFVFNDDAITRKSPIVSTIKDKYKEISFKTYKKWSQICKKCMKNPCECNIKPKQTDDFFPYKGFTIGETLMKVLEGYLIESPPNYICCIYYDIMFWGYKDGRTFIGAYTRSNLLPIEWSNLLGCSYGTFKYTCLLALSKNDFEVICSEDEQIIAISPSKKYRIHLYFESFKFYSLLITLNKCPYCNSDNLGLKKNCKEETVSYCTDCNQYYKTEQSEELDESADNKTPSCPNCGSNNVEDDSSFFLEYTCIDCGHNWGHDFTVECPKCGSDDVENDGTDILQYECNACGHVWGDNEVYDNDGKGEGEEDELNFDHPLSLNDFFPVCGITLNKSTVKDAERQSYLYDKIEYNNSGLVIAWYEGIQIRKEKNSDLFTAIFMTETDKMFPEWRMLGFDWSLSYNDWISLFKRMGFTVIQTKEPQVKSWEHGPDYFDTDVVAISKDYSLKFKLRFSYGRDGYTQYSHSTLYSIKVISKDYCFDWGGVVGKETFHNIEDFLRKEPKKYL